MALNPNVSVGIFSQKDFRGAGSGPLDDCWVMADEMCVHAICGWATITTITNYREKAGVPDTNTGAEGGSLEASLKAIKALWPAIGAMTSIYRGSWTGFLSLAKADHRMVSGSVWSRALGYSTDFRHRVAFYHNGTTWRMLDPLKDSFAVAKDVTEAFVKKAFLDYPEAPEVSCLIFPTVDEVFKTHPLYATQNATEQQLAAAKSIGFQQGKAKAAAAAAAVTEA